jgi:hypothetical protein
MDDSSVAVNPHDVPEAEMVCGAFFIFIFQCRQKHAYNQHTMFFARILFIFGADAPIPAHLRQYVTAQAAGSKNPVKITGWKRLLTDLRT